MGAVLCFVLTVLALPPFAIPGTGYVCLLPLLLSGKPWLVRNPACFHASLAGAAIGAYAYWGANSESLLLYVGCIFLSAILYGTFGCLADRFLTGRSSVASVGSCLALGLIWMVSEQLFNALGFPYSLALTVVESDYLRQMAAVGGASSVGFVLVVCQCLLYQLLSAVWHQEWKRLLSLTLVFVVILTSVVLFAQSRFKELTNSTTADFSVVIAQTDLSGNVVADPTTDDHSGLIMQQHQLLTNKITDWYRSTQQPYVVVWPESALPMLASSVANDVMALSTDGAVATVRHVYTMDSAAAVVSEVRVYDAEGMLVSTNAKLKPVPLAESTIAAVDEFTLHDIVEPKFGSLICYEAAFSNLPRQLVEAGARWLTVSSSDNYQGASFLSHFTLGLLRLRAIETGVSIVRADNGGLSAIINPVGEITAQLPPFHTGILTGNILLSHSPSFYVHYGRQLELLSRFTLLTMLAVSVVHWVRRRRTTYLTSPIATFDRHHRQVLIVLMLALGSFCTVVQSKVIQHQYQRAHAYNPNYLQHPSHNWNDPDVRPAQMNEFTESLHYIHRHFGFGKSRVQMPENLASLSSWANAYGLSVTIGDLLFMPPRVRHATVGLMVLGPQSFAVINGRKNDKARVFIPANGRLSVVAEKKLMALPNKEVYWFIPQHM